MAKPPYPLEALRKLRDDRADAEARRLAAQIERRVKAELELRERERSRREHDERTLEDVTSERERLARGGAKGGDLLRLLEFEAAAAARSGQLAHSESVAREAWSQELREEQGLMQRLAALEAEKKLVRQHQAGFEQEQERLLQRSEEEAALEQRGARRS